MWKNRGKSQKDRAQKIGVGHNHTRTNERRENR